MNPSFTKLSLKKNNKKRVKVHQNYIVNPAEVLREILGPSPPPVIIDLVTPNEPRTGESHIENLGAEVVTPVLNSNTNVSETPINEDSKAGPSRLDLPMEVDAPVVTPVTFTADNSSHGGRSGKNLSMLRKMCDPPGTPSEEESGPEESDPEDSEVVVFVDQCNKKLQQIRNRLEKRLEAIAKKGGSPSTPKSKH